MLRRRLIKSLVPIYFLIINRILVIININSINRIRSNPESFSIANTASISYPNANLLLKSKNYLDKLDNRLGEAINNQNMGACIGGLSNDNSYLYATLGNINMGQSRKNQKNIVRSIDDVTKGIRLQIQNKIQENFGNILNQQKRLNIMDGCIPQPKQKQQAVKKLIQDYWQKRNTDHKNQTFSKRDPQPALPRLQKNQQNNENDPSHSINSQKKAIVSSLNVKIYEKNKLKQRERERQRQIIKKHKQQKILAYLYSYMVHIIDYKVQNDTPQFLLFQKLNYKKWESIEYIMKEIQYFCKRYQIKYCTLDLQKVMQLIDSKNKVFDKNIKANNGNIGNNGVNQNKGMVKGNSENLCVEKRTYTLHQLLGCLEDSEQISLNNHKKAGIRFYGNKGKMRAIVKIQAAWRGRLTYKKIQQLQKLVKNIIKIQRAYKIFKTHCKTKQRIVQSSLQKYKWFTKKQQNFRRDYRVLEHTKKIKYQLHICSDSNNQWQRISNQKFLQKQNAYITRIFKAFINNKQKFKQYQIRQVRIVFVTAYPVSSQICNYYYKLLELGGAVQFRNRIMFMAPEQCENLLQKVPLSRVVYYNSKMIRKLRQLFKNQYAYLVPSNPSPDYIQLCHALDIPLYSSNPQPLLYLQTNSGCKDFIKQLNIYQKQKSRIFSTRKQQHEPQKQTIQYQLPYAKNIYSLSVLINQLTLLVQNYPYVSKWVFKIDNQHSSRGLAFLDVNRVFPKGMIKFLRKCFYAYVPTVNNPICPEIRNLSKQILSILHQVFTDPSSCALTLVSQNVYRTQAQYLNFLYINGGIVQADKSFKDNSTNSLNEADSESLCFCIQIQPDFQWKFLCQFKKIVRKMKIVSCYFEQQLIQPPIQIQTIVKQLIKRKHFGYYVLDFLKPTNKQSPTLNSIKCYLDSFSSSCFLHKFISKQSNMLFIPFILHQNIKKITMSTFFHLCRLQNISFDIQRKIGNIFIFLDGLESGCLGMLTFNDKSKIQTFIHAAEVLDFFYGKIQAKIGHGPSQEFLTIRNCINGFLSSLRRKNMAIKSAMTIQGPQQSNKKKRQSQNYKNKGYLL